jgi:hypothetical protein
MLQCSSESLFCYIKAFNPVNESPTKVHVHTTPNAPTADAVADLNTGASRLRLAKHGYHEKESITLCGNVTRGKCRYDGPAR